MATLEELQARQKEQANRITELKKSNAAKEELDKAVEELKNIKAQISECDPSKASKSSKNNKITLKVPKGTRDHHPQAMMLRKKLFNTITDVFEKHGGVTIDTPVFELKEILAGKYGEDSKLIYDLADQGGEICSLRYDLTVPFARFLAMNTAQYQKIKRYHIAKVYRRDNPAMNKGRMREFYQCDFDIAGVYDAMLPDAETIAIVVEVLRKLKIGEFTVKLNHRKVLDGMFAVCGTPQNLIRPISSAVDKLDKLPWEEVRKEMTVEKGLDPAIADRIGEYVKLKGKRDLLDRLLKDEKLLKNADAKKGLEEMVLLFEYLELFDVTEPVSFDLSLARGLDYYTGMIFEGVTEGSAPPSFTNPEQAAATTTTATTSKTSAKEKKPSKKSKKGEEEEEEIDENQVGIGSIVAGGRYDGLVGMFSGGTQIPCVGLSFGVERLYSILHQQATKEDNLGSGKETEVYVMSVGTGMLKERMQIVKTLWDAGIKAEFMYKAKPKVSAQFEVLDKDKIPFAVIVGPEEYEQGIVRLKEQVGKEAAENVEGDDKKGVAVPMKDMVPWLQERLAAAKRA